MINLLCVLSLSCAAFLPEIFASKDSLEYELSVLKGQYQKLLESNLKLAKDHDRIFNLLYSLADKDKEIDTKLTPLLKINKKKPTEICQKNRSEQKLSKFSSSVPRCHMNFARYNINNVSAFLNNNSFQETGNVKPASSMKRKQYFRKRQSTDGTVAFDAKVLESLSNLGDNQKFPFKTVTLDTHNAFHGDSGIFTCPRAGIYAFFATILTYPGKEIDFNIMKNGHWIAAGYSKDDDEVDTFGSGTTQGVAHLQTGDKVWIQVIEAGHPGSGSMIYKEYSSFMGFSLD